MKIRVTKIIGWILILGGFFLSIWNYRFLSPVYDLYMNNGIWEGNFFYGMLGWVVSFEEVLGMISVVAMVAGVVFLVIKRRKK